MSIVLARVDNRLIHGQVLEAWIPFCQANCIVVANDAIAAQLLQKKIMAAAVPSSIRVVIDSLQRVASLFAQHELEGERVLMLFATPADARLAHELGIPFSELNLGNLHGGPGKQRVSCTLALDDADVEALRRLDQHGVVVTSRCVPSDHPCDWKKLCEEGGR